MIVRILSYLILVLLVAISTIYFTMSKKNERLETDINNLNKAIIAYEDLIKVVPFNRLVEERGNNANEEINATLNSSNDIADDTYWM